MTDYFNLSGLEHIYKSTLESYDKSFAFNINIGKGQFLLMMFISVEDKDTRDFLFIYMRNTNVLKKIKLYGNHTKGDFRIYMTFDLEKAIFKELQINKANGHYSISKFMEQLNNAIPDHLDSIEKIHYLRANRHILQYLNVIDEREKTVLIGDKKVSNGTPQDKTLRKLYLYTDAQPNDIDVLIRLLKLANRTVAWTTEDQRYRAKNIYEIIKSLEDN